MSNDVKGNLLTAAHGYVSAWRDGTEEHEQEAIQELCRAAEAYAFEKVQEALYDAQFVCHCDIYQPGTMGTCFVCGKEKPKRKKE